MSDTVTRAKEFLNVERQIAKVSAILEQLKARRAGGFAGGIGDSMTSRRRDATEYGPSDASP